MNACLDLTLFEAVAHGDKVALLHAIQTGVDVNLAREENGTTPLMRAVLTGNCEVISLLIDHGAEVDCHNLEGWSPLMWASMRNSCEVIWLLIGRGADVNAASEVGWTPLMTAANFGNFEASRMLLSFGANPCKTFNADSGPMTAAQLAGARGNEEMKLLLQAHEQAAELHAAVDAATAGRDLSSPPGLMNQPFGRRRL